MDRNLLLVALLLSVLLLGLHLYAIETYAYWYYKWFDIPMHILGGATLGAFILALGFRKSWQYALLMVCVVVGWEVFEYVASISTGQPNYWMDTIGDMINGLLGATISYVLIQKIWR